jgi:hypothetical protein
MYILSKQITLPYYFYFFLFEESEKTAILHAKKP